MEDERKVNISEENELYALARTLQNSTPAQHEIQDFLQAMQQKIDQEYIQKIRMAASALQQNTASHPPREVGLLRALAAYADESGRSHIEQICQQLLFLQTLQQIQTDVTTLSADGALLCASSKEDCSVSTQTIHMTGLCMMLALISQI